MNIERIEAHDFRSWGELDLRIEPGVTLISGANGAGKSSALEAVEFCLFGATSDAGRLIRRGTDEARVMVTLQTEQGIVIVERTVRRSGTGTKIGLQVWRGAGDDDQDPVGAATTTETQAILDGLLGVSREVLHASAFSMQHSGGAFTEAKPADRKRILTETMPSLALWQPLADAAKADQRAAQGDAEGRRIELDRLDGASERAVEAESARIVAVGVRMDAEIDETAAEIEVTRLAGEAEAAREARRQHAAAVEQQQRAQADHDRANAERQAADEALDRARAAAENAPSVEDAQALAREADLQLAEAQHRHEVADKAERRHCEQLAEAQRQIASHQAAYEQHEAEAVELEERKRKAQTEGCPECGKPLDQPEDGAVIERAIARHAYALTNRDQEQEAVEQWRTRESYLVANAPAASFETLPALVAARSAADEARTKLAEAQTIQRLAGSVEAAVERCRTLAQRENETHAALEAANASVLTINSQNQDTDVEQRHHAALTAVTEARAAHSAAAAELARAEEAAKTAERDATAETTARERLAAAEHDAAILGVLVAGFSPSGIPAMVIDNVLGDLADEANRVLAELGAPIRVDLRSQKLLKSSDRLADTLDIIVTMDAMEAPYETLSGGERTRVALALRAALTRMLASKRGARVRILVVDEPAGLDSTGCEQLAAVLNEFVAAGVFETVLLVTHQTELADLVGRVVRIEKTAGGASRLLESAAGISGVAPGRAHTGATNA